MKKNPKVCVGCGDNFLTLKNYDYCKGCELNGSRYLNKNSDCSECDGSGMIKFRRQKPRSCKLCVLTKPNMKKKLTKKTSPKLTKEESF
jgi:DnaJ-class molecular chaperone